MSYPGLDKSNKTSNSYYRLSYEGESYLNPHIPSRVVCSFEAEVIEESGAVCSGTVYRSLSGDFRETSSYNDDDFIMRGSDSTLCYEFRQCYWKCSGTIHGWKKVIVNDGYNREYECFVDGSTTDFACAPGGFDGKKYEHQIVSCGNDGDM